MNNKKTFHEVSEIWCDAKRPIVKHSTLCAYQLTLQTHLLPRFGAAENITEKDVQQFVIDKCTSGLARKTVPGYSGSAQICYQIPGISTGFSILKNGKSNILPKQKTNCRPHCH